MRGIRVLHAVVDSRVTPYRVHFYNLNLNEELVDIKFTKEPIDLVGAVKHT